MKGKILRNRFNLIKKYVKDKSVLDLGCVEHDALTEKKKFWLHKFIRNYAKELVGVDFEEKEVKKLNKKGYNIIIDNVETMRLNKKFEIIMAGELIEHLSNVGLFLNSSYKHMGKNSKLIITTPNTFAIRRVFRNILFGTNVNNFNHTYYFDFRTLKENFDRENFKIVEWYYFFDSNKPFYKYWVERSFAFFRPVFSSNILFVLRKK